jgi:ArsR family transcriptional regulator
MDMPYLLDILGNENRRNILTLLSYRPCYVTEISEELGVAPKAIIDHLKILEAAGLVESFHDEQGRKYYEIANNVRMEVSISPLMFDVNVSRVEITTEEQRTIRERYVEARSESAGALKRMSEELQGLGRSAMELREAQKSVQGSISEVTGMCIELINRLAADQIEAEVLYLLIRGPTSYEELTGKLNIPGEEMRSELAKLLKKGLVTYKKGLWSIK